MYIALKIFLPRLHLIEKPTTSFLYPVSQMALASLLHKWTDCNISNDKRVRSQAITIAYDSPFFLANLPKVMLMFLEIRCIRLPVHHSF